MLLPHEVPMLQRARKMKKAALISNFVDREHARPALTVNDFVAPLLLESPPEPNQDHITSDNQNQRSVFFFTVSLCSHFNIHVGSNTLVP